MGKAECCLCVTLAKWILIAFNIAFFLGGAAMLGIGIWVVVDPSFLHNFLGAFDTGALNISGLLNGAAYALIALGGFIFLIGFTGFCGACTQSKLCLTVYIVCVSVVLVVQIVALVLGAIFYNDIKSTALSALTTSITSNYRGKWSTTNSISLAWDYAQLYFDCCGVTNYTDFNTATNWDKTYNYNGNTYTITVPYSCCKQDDTQFPLGTMALTDPMCPVNPSTSNSYFQTSCYDSIVNYINTYSLVTICVVAGVLAVEIVGIIAALCICKNTD